MGYPYTPDYAAPYPAAPTREQQIEALKGQAGYMESELEAVRKRIEALEAKTGEE
jgi:predicted  nucleic acid-binding Zn-ribbon protein